MKKEDALFVFGLLVIVIAVLLLIEGSILGERTSEIAALLGIVGIVVVGFASRLRKGKGLF
jgi:hypothetical protein